MCQQLNRKTMIRKLFVDQNGMIDESFEDFNTDFKDQIKKRCQQLNEEIVQNYLKLLSDVINKYY
jgi:hypothetical protein